MAKNSILNLIEEATSKTLGPDIERFAKANDLTIGEGEGKVSCNFVTSEIERAAEYFYGLFTRENFKGERYAVPGIDIKEALSSSDASVVFKRVISEVLIEPREPALWLMNNVANEIKLDAKAPLTVTFPSISAFQAFEVAEGGEYRPQSAGFQEHILSLRLKKIGVMAGLTEEMVEASIYPLVRLHLKMMGNGINRKIENLLFTGLTQKALEVFNNDGQDSNYYTSGVNASQTFNGSLALKDILKLAAVVVGNRYEPDSILVHPLAYYIIFQDPIIRSTFFHQGQIGSTIWNQKNNFDQSTNMPFGINYVPYYALPYQESAVMTYAPGSGFASSLLTDVYVIDSKNALTMITRGDNEFDDLEDWHRDVLSMKARRYVNVAAMDGGKAMTVARNVSVVENFAPLFTVRNTV